MPSITNTYHHSSNKFQIIKNPPYKKPTTIIAYNGQTNDTKFPFMVTLNGQFMQYTNTKSEAKSLIKKWAKVL